jgi:hypothetical protein
MVIETRGREVELGERSMSDMIDRPKLFQPDSGDHDILAEAVSLAPADGLFLEIGLRRGGSMKVILDGVVGRGIDATIVSLDCYGHMPYMVREGIREDFDYTNGMRNETLPGIYDYIRDKSINFLFFNLEDTEFFARFADGVPIYSGKTKVIANKYGFAHIDAQHTLEAVMTEVNFILNVRDMPGTILCFDDVYAYDHDAVESIVLKNGYETVRRGRAKAAYRRM